MLVGPLESGGKEGTASRISGCVPQAPLSRDAIQTTAGRGLHEPRRVEEPPLPLALLRAFFEGALRGLSDHPKSSYALGERLRSAPLPIDAEPPRSPSGDQEEDPAVEDRELSVILDREEASRGVCHEVGHRHRTATDEGG